MAIAFVLGVGLTVLWFWAKNKNVSIKWWEWVLGLLGVVLVSLTVQNIMAADYEEVSRTVVPFLLVTGLPGLILLVIPWQTVWRRMRSGA
jgi:phosphatidylserine synthase